MLKVDFPLPVLTAVLGTDCTGTTGEAEELMSASSDFRDDLSNFCGELSSISGLGLSLFASLESSFCAVSLSGKLEISLFSSSASCDSPR